MNLRLLLSFLTFFSASVCWAQIDSTAKTSNKPHYIEDFRITDLLIRYSENYKGKPIDGYRIQLYSGKRIDANDMRKKALQNFLEIKTVLTYESPDYKVQMGNFRSELEAEKNLRLIRTVFPGAFVVKSKINLPELSIENKDEL